MLGLIIAGGTDDDGPAELRGQPGFADVLANLDTVSGTCPACEAEVWPDELQEIE